MNRIKKVLAIIIVAIILIGVLLTVGIGNYFVNYAIVRSGDGGNREIKEDSNLIIDLIQLENLFLHGEELTNLALILKINQGVILVTP